MMNGQGVRTSQQVFVIDDDDAVRDAICMLLETESISYKAFTSADAFYTAYQPNWRGCVVLDIRMPGMSGLDLQVHLKAAHSTLPIIFITGHGDVPMAVEAMRHGAYDFLRKPIKEGDFLERITLALQHESGVHDQIDDQLQIREKLASLTQREREVFECVVAGQANKQIAHNLGISERTVEVHRSQVMKKLEVKNLAQLVRLHIENEDAGI